MSLVIDIDEAIDLMEKEITAHEKELKKRQIEFALRLKLNKSGTMLSDQSIALIANTIRTVAEIKCAGAEKMQHINFLVNDNDIKNLS